MDDQHDALPTWLTDDEHRVLALTAELANLFGQIVGDGRSRQNDLGEAVHHIHVLQRMVMAQAAGRAYPDLYRRMGEVLDAPEPPTVLPAGVIIGRSMSSVHEMLPRLLAATEAYVPTVSRSRSTVTWANGRVAHLRSDREPDSLRGMSVGWAYVEPGCLSQATGFHLRMALREQPGKIVEAPSDVAALIA